MPLTVRQHKSGGLANQTVSATVLSVTLTAAPVAGSLFVSLGASGSNNTVATTGFTLIDTGANGWSAMTQYRVARIGDSATQPVSATANTVNQGVAGILYELAGQSATSFINQHNHTNSTLSGTTTGCTVTTASITPTVPGCLIIAGVETAAGASFPSGLVTPNGSFLNDETLYENGTGAAVLISTASFIQNTVAPVSCTFTITFSSGTLGTTACDTFIMAIAPDTTAMLGTDFYPGRGPKATRGFRPLFFNIRPINQPSVAPDSATAATAQDQQYVAISGSFDLQVVDVVPAGFYPGRGPKAILGFRRGFYPSPTTVQETVADNAPAATTQDDQRVAASGAFGPLDVRISPAPYHPGIGPRAILGFKRTGLIAAPATVQETLADNARATTTQDQQHVSGTGAVGNKGTAASTQDDQTLNASGLFGRAIYELIPAGFHPGAGPRALLGFRRTGLLAPTTVQELVTDSARAATAQDEQHSSGIGFTCIGTGATTQDEQRVAASALLDPRVYRFTTIYHPGVGVRAILGFRRPGLLPMPESVQEVVVNYGNGATVQDDQRTASGASAYLPPPRLIETFHPGRGPRAIMGFQRAFLYPSPTNVQEPSSSNIQGTGQCVQDKQRVAGIAFVAPRGAAAVHQNEQVVHATATFIALRTGTGAVHQDEQQVHATATFATQGHAGSHQDQQHVSASGREIFAAHAATHQDEQRIAASGRETFIGSAHSTQDEQRVHAHGTSVALTHGSGATIQAEQTINAHGFTPPQVSSWVYLSTPIVTTLILPCPLTSTLMLPMPITDRVTIPLPIPTIQGAVV